MPKQKIVKPSLYTLLILVGISLFSCQEEEVVPESKFDKLHLIGEQEMPELGLEIGLYADNKALTTGYQRLYFRLNKKEDSAPDQDASLRVQALMDMGEMRHGAPVEDFSYDAKTGTYTGAVVFVMPSTAGAWKLEVAITGQNEQSASVDFPLEINQPENPRLISFIHQEKSYFISLISPAQAEVGTNDFEIAVHQKKSMMEWPASEDFTFNIHPYMPAMGHGSPNNQDPVHIGNGHYKGKVNFSMDGHWQIGLDAQINGNPIAEELAFEITFSQVQ